MPSQTLSVILDAKSGGLMTALQAAKAQTESFVLDLHKATGTLSNQRAVNDQAQASWVELRNSIKSAREEAARYQETLEKGVAEKHATRLSKDESDETIRSANAYKELLAAKKASRAESERYQATLAGMAGRDGPQQKTFYENERIVNLRGQLKERQEAERIRVASIVASVNSGTAASMREAVIAAEVKSQLGNGGNKIDKWIKKISGTSSGSMSQLVSVVSNTMSSLGSGMNPMRVLMQQLPNVIQALVMFGDDLLAVGRKVLFFFANPITLGAVAAFAVIGVAAYKVSSYFKALAKTIEDVSNKYGIAGASVNNLDDAMRDNNNTAREYASWLDKISRNTKSLADSTGDLIETLKDRWRYELEIAKLRGASAGDLLSMQLSQMREELRIITLARLEQKKKNEEAMIAAESAKNAINSKKNDADRAELLAANTALEKTKATEQAAMAKVAIRKAELENEIRNFWGDTLTKVWETRSVPGSASPITEMVERSAKRELDNLLNGVMEVNGEYTSYNSARSAREGARALVERLTGKQDSLAASLDARKSEVEKGTESEKSLTDRAKKLESAIANMSTYGPTVNGLSMSDPKQTLSSNQQIGAYAGSYQPTMLTETKKIQLNTQAMLTEMQKMKSYGDNVDIHF